MENLDQLKQKTAWISILSNTLLVALKFIVGFYTGAMSLISEAMHSSVDLLAALIAFWAVHKSSVPPDTEHDYGHGKYENISSAIEALLIVGAAIGIIYEAAEKLNMESAPQFLEYGIAIMGGSMILNYFVSRRLMEVAKKTGSQALEADGLHLRADMWTSAGVLAGLLGMQLTGWYWLDPAIAIFVACIIFHAGWGMVTESTKELTDTSLPPEDEERIGAIFMQRKEVLGYHCLRTRKSGSYKLLDVHLLFDENMTLAKVHAICDDLEKQIHAAFGTFDVLIHPEPAGHTETNAAQYKKAHIEPRP